MDVKNPVAGEIKLPSNGRARERRLEVHEIDLLQKYLTGEAKYFFQLSIETGMRRGEMMSLEWKNIDYNQSTALLFDTKNGENRAVPLSRNAIKILKCLQVNEDAKYVFSITTSQLRKSWEFARKEAQIPDLRLHDLRHEATSRLFEKGLNVIEAASVTGHKTLSMLKRYTHLNPSEIAKKLG